MLALTREPRELPNQDFLEGRVGAAGFIEHLAELRSIGGSPRFGFVDVLASDDVTIAFGEVSEGP